MDTCSNTCRIDWLRCYLCRLSCFCKGATENTLSVLLLRLPNFVVCTPHIVKENRESLRIRKNCSFTGDAVLNLHRCVHFNSVVASFFLHQGGKNFVRFDRSVYENLSVASEFFRFKVQSFQTRSQFIAVNAGVVFIVLLKLSC